MWMSPEAYLKRIMFALEEAIAPAVEDDAVRGQVYAVVDLLNQLASQVEFKRSIIQKEVEEARELLKQVLGKMEEAGVHPPSELSRFLQEPAGQEQELDPGLKSRMEEAVCEMIAHFYENKARLSPELARDLDKSLREYLTQGATQELGLLKPPRIERISRPQRPENK